MSTEINVANGIKADLKCPNNSTITVDNINSNNGNCDNGKAMDVFINKCVGENTCAISEKDLQCPGNIDVEYRCIDEDGNEVNKAKLDASYNDGNGEDFNFDATIVNNSNLGGVINNNTGEITTSSEDTNITDNNITESTTSTINESSTSTNSDETEDDDSQSYSNIIIFIVCLIFIGILLFLGWGLFKNHKTDKSVISSDSTLSDTSSFGKTTGSAESSVPASSSSIKL